MICTALYIKPLNSGGDGLNAWVSEIVNMPSLAEKRSDIFLKS